MLDVIADAINSHSKLSFNYSPGMRDIEPHALGYSEDGNPLLRAYQVSGASESGEYENWKLFRVDHADGVQMSGEKFNGPRPGYRRGDKAMKGGIIAEL